MSYDNLCGQGATLSPTGHFNGSNIWRCSCPTLSDITLNNRATSLLFYGVGHDQINEFVC